MSGEFFHGRDHQIWDYCIYLGPYVEGDSKYDLGVCVDGALVSLAAVWGTRDCEYRSGEMTHHGEPLDGFMNIPIYQEAHRRYMEHLNGGEER